MTRLIDVEETHKFWSGTKLRRYGVGLNVDDESEDYYDYILAYAHWEKDSMMLVNITDGNSKAGSVYSGTVPIDTATGQAVINIKGLKHTLGEDLQGWYLRE